MDQTKVEKLEATLKRMVKHINQVSEMEPDRLRDNDLSVINGTEDFEIVITIKRKNGQVITARVP
jgi:hypothetical protein